MFRKQFSADGEFTILQIGKYTTLAVWFLSSFALFFFLFSFYTLGNLIDASATNHRNSHRTGTCKHLSAHDLGKRNLYGVNIGIYQSLKLRTRIMVQCFSTVATPIDTYPICCALKQKGCTHPPTNINIALARSTMDFPCWNSKTIYKDLLNITVAEAKAGIRNRYIYEASSLCKR